MAPYEFTVILLMLTAGSFEAAAFDVHRHDANRVRIRLTADEAIILPRKYAPIRSPLSKPHFHSVDGGQKLYLDLSRSKKPPKYFKSHQPVADKSKLSPLSLEDYKNYNEGQDQVFRLVKGEKQEVPFEDLFHPVSLQGSNGASFHGSGSSFHGDGSPLHGSGVSSFHDFSNGYGVSSNVDHFADEKPVTEHIEGDLKYDFRTKTHSID